MPLKKEVGLLAVIRVCGSTLATSGAKVEPQNILLDLIRATFRHKSDKKKPNSCEKKAKRCNVNVFSTFLSLVCTCA